MLELAHETESVADFTQHTSQFLRQLKESGTPVILTVDGKAEFVVQDAASYQRLVSIAERAELHEALQQSIADFRDGKGIPGEKVLAEMRQILAERQTK